MYADLVQRAVSIPSSTWALAERLSDELDDREVLPLVGAGASRDCGAPSATDLAKMLYDVVMATSIRTGRPPVAAMRRDLGKMADALALIDGGNPSRIFDSLGFHDHAAWPSGDDLFKDTGSVPHPCAYRVLARMARERFVSEAVTFNYDCNFEGGLLQEGFFGSGRAVTHGRWPEIFTVVADAESHAAVTRRGEFVVNKVHGCVDTWRRTREARPKEADEAIVIRWSQLLDWRQDEWSRDLVRDRARRHILLLVGFSGSDPVIHSTVQAIMREVQEPTRAVGPSRVRVVDVNPRTLTLQMLLAAGQGAANDTIVAPVRKDRDISLAATLLALHAAGIRRRLRKFADGAALDAHVPSDREAMLQRLVLSGPAMMRWTWAILGETPGVWGFAGLKQVRDAYYVPLCAEPDRTIRTFEIRDELASRFGLTAESMIHARSGSFVIVPRRGKAYMPVGLRGHEVSLINRRRLNLAWFARELDSSAGRLDRLIVVRDEQDDLRAYSLDTGVEARL